MAGDRTERLPLPLSYGRPAADGRFIDAPAVAFSTSTAGNQGTPAQTSSSRADRYDAPNRAVVGARPSDGIDSRPTVPTRIDGTILGRESTFRQR